MKIEREELNAEHLGLLGKSKKFWVSGNARKRLCSVNCIAHLVVLERQVSSFPHNLRVFGAHTVPLESVWIQLGQPRLLQSNFWFNVYKLHTYYTSVPALQSETVYDTPIETSAHRQTKERSQRRLSVNEKVGESQSRLGELLFFKFYTGPG